jgi:hypothetical protein
MFARTGPYSFDQRSNRTGLTAAPGEPTLGCPTSGGTTTTHSHDSADRIVDTSYSYDAFGRATTAPGHGTIDYYANDLAYRQTAGGQRQPWTLDAAPARRLAPVTAAWSASYADTRRRMARASSPRHR